VKHIATPAIAEAAAVAVAGCTSLTPPEDPVNMRLTALDARLRRIERQLESESLITMSSRVDQLRADVAALRGQIEEVQFAVEGNAQRQRDLYLDLDSRLQALEQSRGQAGLAPSLGGSVGSPSFGGPSAVPPTVSQPPVGGSGQLGAAAGSNVGGPAASPSFGTQASAAVPPGPGLSGTDQDNYNRAYELLETRKDYAGAQRAFTEFLAAFPTSPLAPNAQYWLGESLYARQMYQEALPEIPKVIDVYPGSLKEPDAMLKLGFVHDALGNKDAARTTLQQVMQKYPNTIYERLASARLTQLTR